MSDLPAAMTVAVPCFNAAGTIAQTLSSLLNQTRPPAEILVVDDGSTDDTSNIVSHFQEVTLIAHETNQGLAAARNTAWRRANGDIIVYVDADVTADPNLLEALAGGYNSKDVAGVGGQAVEVYVNSDCDRFRQEFFFQTWGNYPLDHAKFLFGLCCSFRRDVLKQLGGFNPLFCVSGEDMDFSYRVRQAGFRLVFNPQARIWHHRRDDLESIKKMVYRHCFWGFKAQRLNKCYDQKIPLAHSAWKFMDQFFTQGLLKGQWRYAALILILHGYIFKAWLDAWRRLPTHSPAAAFSDYLEERQARTASR